MTKFKIFASTFPSGLSPNTKPADVYANEWLEKHPNIEVIDMKYQQAHHGDHSICIMYKEETNHEQNLRIRGDNYVPLVTCCVCGRSNRDNPSLRFGVAPFGLAAPSGYICEDCAGKEL